MIAPDEPAVLMANITKVYPGNVVANDHVSLMVRQATIHAVVGENGAGKSTLMSILYGAVRPDEGRIRLRGKDIILRSPADAIRSGIGMVTQHSSLIPALTVLDGILLGHETSALGFLRRRAAAERLEAIASRLEISVPWSRPARELTVAALQKAEIVRALYRGATILILDEPTAALAPQEAEALYTTLHGLVADGATVIVVTHRLQEVIAHASRVTVLRQGRRVSESDTSLTTMREIAAQMVGGTSQPLTELASPEAPSPDTDGGYQSTDSQTQPSAGHRLPVLELNGVCLGKRGSTGHAPSDGGDAVPPALDLSVNAGEIVGVAGVDGNGQRELADVVIGLAPCAKGRVIVNGIDVTHAPLRRRMTAGLACCPEDRQTEGLILSFDLAENLLLPNLDRTDMGAGACIKWPRVRRTASEAMQTYGIRAFAPDVPAGSLSGGNQQKLLLARAMVRNPACLLALQPTRGLDIHAAHAAFEVIRHACARGMGVLLISLDLDELLERADRIAVLYSHRLVGVLPRRAATREIIGALMTTGQLPQ